ncbi:diguanylate phosphodiesterase [Citrobacter amalonaticus]|uniref:Diguanylate phosphodiesterase n=1 Tax=Citrobacter amalonaticus TaxID=35703 RepID=A0A2S4S1L5_CITAM|nr:EAL domain-containing protein [Citrobacter amalonaticus]POT55101.1 diguanylate phosphodiesterase [Citrobacter amalonaticus]POT77292.1 diguanylate phosphodiesterase [Citrobacter amalonaticus]POU67743.1 diguanylate phosphodiesterase [Citrobacter amalonaticus]POV07348.1 diguanylate phosphodiesterase [Citrobacter amalonaticus]
MHYHFIAEPLMETAGSLLGVEIFTRFYSENSRVLHPAFIIAMWDIEQKRRFLLDQLHAIDRKRTWFEEHSLFCSLNIDFDMALLACKEDEIKALLSAMPFVALELSESFPVNNDSTLIDTLSRGANALWLADLGSGNANVSLLLSGYFQVAKIDRAFFTAQVEKPTFPPLVKNIRQYCGRVIVEGIEQTRHIETVKNAGVWGMQGALFPSVTLQEVERLLQPERFH